MAYCLRLLYLEERHYIHKLYSSKKNNTNPKTTTNMNFAMLFDSEGKANHWRQINNLPKNFEIVFIPVSFEDEVEKKAPKKYYNILKQDGKSLNDSIPDFFNEV